MNKIKYIIIVAIAAISLMIAGCNKIDNSNAAASNANNAAMNTNANSNANTTTETKNDSTSTGSMATPTDAYKFAYDCRKRKDIECLKKVMTKDIIEFFTEIGKEDKKSADDMLKELVEKPQAATCEFRKEKIEGDYASIEYLDEKGGWSTMDFEKVGTDWKMGFPKKPDGPPKK